MEYLNIKTEGSFVFTFQSILSDGSVALKDSLAPSVQTKRKGPVFHSQVGSKPGSLRE